MRELHAWMGDSPVGVFLEDSEGNVSLEYAKGVDMPISLSLPLDGKWARKAPSRFLENLLPDNPTAREAMMRASGAAGTDSFDLLDGADSSGGLVFSLRDDYPAPRSQMVSFASDDDIASRISSARSAPMSWWQHDSHARFSLAGNQPKFTLARIGDRWAWPNAAIPSTHIFKPPEQGTADADIVEAASNRLVRLCGLESSKAGVMEFAGERTYVIERFDRRPLESGKVSRLHTEDFLQSLGLPPERKYTVKAKDVLHMLHRADPADGLCYSWIAQLALNVSVGNVDAHAKNYSLMFSPDGIRLSPMYDVLTTTFWPWVSAELPMRIGGVAGAKDVTPRHWEKLASENDLDPERVVGQARRMAGLVLSNIEEAYSDVEPRIRDRILMLVDSANTKIDPTYDSVSMTDDPTGMLSGLMPSANVDRRL